MEEQTEELEVLDAIYGEDKKFTVLNSTHFQYKYGEDGEDNAFVLDIIWPDDYPCLEPTFNLDSFYNSLMIPSVKICILAAIKNEAATNRGSVQTYNMIEWVREKREVLFLTALLDKPKEKESNKPVHDADKDTATSSSLNPKKKEQMTKSQKRRDWDKRDAKGEVARGGDWVDIVKHLSQTGSHETNDSNT